MRTRQTKKIVVFEDIIPIGQFKTHASEVVRRLQKSGRPMIIVQNGHPSAVVVTTADFDELGYRELVRAKLAAGIASAKKKTHSVAAVRARLKAKARGPTQRCERCG